MDEELRVRCRTGRPGSPPTGSRSPTSSGSPPGVERWEDWCSAWSAAAPDARGPRARGAGRGPHPLGRRAPVHGRGLLPLRQVPLRRVPGRDARRARARGAPASTDALPYLDPPGRAGRDPVRGQPAGRHPAAAGRAPARTPSSSWCRAWTPPRRSSARPRRSSSSAAWRPSRVDGPGQGEAEYDLPIRGDWEVPGAGDRRRASRRSRASIPSGSASGA